MSRMASHRVMALLRGQREGILNISVTPAQPTETLVRRMASLKFHKTGELLAAACGESLERHLLDSLGNEVLRERFETAERDSLAVFSRNLENLLLFPPFGGRAVIGIDPGIRTGCKAAVLDERGDYREFMTLRLNVNEQEAEKLLSWVERYSVKGVAVGSGTFGRETYRIVKRVLEGTGVVTALVDEDGASIYSASEEAREEFPDLDVTVKGAISIGRRFQDPMAELVKIDPRSLGIGQYQHDINPALMRDRLRETVEWAVNRVGVNLNTAGYQLLGYVSGLDRKKARQIVSYRSRAERIRSREELRNIPGIGPKAYEQAAGFLRIREGDHILDGTGVHPESYGDVEKIAAHYGMTLEELVAHPGRIDAEEIRRTLGIRELDSLLSELHQKGLDPRSEFSTVEFRDDITSLEDLTEGMVLTGVVDNIVAFGVFVDIGLKEKGLVHVSEVSDSYVKDINSLLSVGDQIRVRVLGVDRERKRIALSCKGLS